MSGSELRIKFHYLSSTSSERWGLGWCPPWWDPKRWGLGLLFDSSKEQRYPRNPPSCSHPLKGRGQHHHVKSDWEINLEKHQGLVINISLEQALLKYCQPWVVLRNTSLSCDRVNVYKNICHGDLPFSITWVYYNPLERSNHGSINCFRTIHGLQFKTHSVHQLLIRRQQRPSLAQEEVTGHNYGGGGTAFWKSSLSQVSLCLLPLQTQRHWWEGSPLL